MAHLEAAAGDAERPLRRDAERNRQRIMAAAAEVFAREGLDVTMDEIARHAGVGVGTVYRRFPNKDALIDALFEQRIAAMVEAAQRALADEDPWRALTTFLHEIVAAQAADQGTKQLMMARKPGRVRVEQVRQQIAPLATRLVERAQQAGELRPDLSPTDMPLINVMLGTVGDFTQEVSPDAWRRLLTIVLDGLRTRRDAPTPLPGEPLSFEQVDEAMSTWHRR